MAAREMNKMHWMICAGALLLSACGGHAPGQAQSQASGQAPLAGASMGGAFSLVDQNGRRVTGRDFAGKYRLVYFGYSFCPDVCPVDLQQIGAGVRAFEKAEPARAARLVPIFITVDPARDTPAELKKFAAAFHPRMVALTGSEAEIAAVAKRYGVAYSKQGTGPSYMMGHTRMAVLYGPDGTPIAIVPHDEGPAAIEKALAQWVV